MSRIEITGVSLEDFAKKVYELSVPRGLGLPAYEEGGLSDEYVNSLMTKGRTDMPLSMDYVKGRDCKMVVFKDIKNRLFIQNPWFDHTNEQLVELLDTFDIKYDAITGKHNLSCECRDCDRKQLQ